MWIFGHPLRCVRGFADKGNVLADNSVPFPFRVLSSLKFFAPPRPRPQGAQDDLMNQPHEVRVRPQSRKIAYYPTGIPLSGFLISALRA